LDRPDSEIRKKAENFTFYVIEYASMIDRSFTEIIISEFVRDRTKYINFLEYYEKQHFGPRKELVKIILQSKYELILQQHPNIFDEIGEIQKWRNRLAHYTKHYEANPDSSYTFVLHHPIIKKQIRLSNKKMEKILCDAEKCYKKFFELRKKVLKISQNS